MLNFNNELLKIIKKRNLSKTLKDFFNREKTDVCILLNKNIDLDKFRLYLTRLLKQDILIETMSSSGNFNYYYISNFEKYVSFSRTGVTLRISQINEIFMKEEYIYKIDDMTDLLEIEATDSNENNNSNGFFDYERMPAYVSVDWARPSIDTRSRPRPISMPNFGHLNFDETTQSLNYTTRTSNTTRVED